MKNVIKRCAPGYILLEPFELKRRVGGFEVATPEGDDAPQIGKVLQVGSLITKMPYEADQLPKIGEVWAYKKYNAFKFSLGAVETYAVHFSNILFEIETSN